MAESQNTSGVELPQLNLSFDSFTQFARHVCPQLQEDRVFVETTEPLELDQVVLLEVGLRRGHILLRILGVVVDIGRRAQGDEGMVIPGVTLRLDYVDPASQSLLEALLERRDRIPRGQPPVVRRDPGSPLLSEDSWAVDIGSLFDSAFNEEIQSLDLEAVPESDPSESGEDTRPATSERELQRNEADRLARSWGGEQDPGAVTRMAEVGEETRLVVTDEQEPLEAPLAGVEKPIAAAEKADSEAPPEDRDEGKPGASEDPGSRAATDSSLHELLAPLSGSPSEAELERLRDQRLRKGMAVSVASTSPSWARYLMVALAIAGLLVGATWWLRSDSAPDGAPGVDADPGSPVAQSGSLQGEEVGGPTGSIDPSVETQPPVTAVSGADFGPEPTARPAVRSGAEAARPPEAVGEPPNEPLPRELLVRWAKAWSDQEPERFVSFFAGDYSPPGLTREQWLEQRRVRIRRPESLEVSVSDVEVVEVSADQQLVRFHQQYAADGRRLSTWKTMDWRHTEDGWRIVAVERTTAPGGRS